MLTRRDIELLSSAGVDWAAAEIRKFDPNHDERGRFSGSDHTHDGYASASKEEIVGHLVSQHGESRAQSEGQSHATVGRRHMDRHEGEEVDDQLVSPATSENRRVTMSDLTQNDLRKLADAGVGWAINELRKYNANHDERGQFAASSSMAEHLQSSHATVGGADGLTEAHRSLHRGKEGIPAGSPTHTHTAPNTAYSARETSTGHTVHAPDGSKIGSVERRRERGRNLPLFNARDADGKTASTHTYAGDAHDAVVRRHKGGADYEDHDKVGVPATGLASSAHPKDLAGDKDIKGHLTNTHGWDPHAVRSAGNAELGALHDREDHSLQDHTHEWGQAHHASDLTHGRPAGAGGGGGPHLGPHHADARSSSSRF